MIQNKRNSPNIKAQIDISTSNNLENISDISNNNIEEEKNKISILSPAYNFCKSLKDINSQNETGWTPLYKAMIANNISALSELLKLGAEPNISNNLGETPLYLSVENQNFDALKILLEFNADTNLQKRNGNTPLHLAFQKNLEKKFIIELLKNNSNPNILNKLYNQTPTHLALINKSDEDILKLLKDNKANIYDIKDKYDKTPFDYVKQLNDNDYKNKVESIFGKERAKGKEFDINLIEINLDDNINIDKNDNINNIDNIDNIGDIENINIKDNFKNIENNNKRKESSSSKTFQIINNINLSEQGQLNILSNKKNDIELNEIKDEDITIKFNNTKNIINKNKDIKKNNNNNINLIIKEDNNKNINNKINNNNIAMSLDISKNNYLLNSINNIVNINKKNNNTESKNIISLPEYIKFDNGNNNIQEKFDLINKYLNIKDKYNAISRNKNIINNNYSSTENNNNNLFSLNINSSLSYTLSKEISEKKNMIQKIKNIENNLEINCNKLFSNIAETDKDINNKNKIFSNTSETGEEIIENIISNTAKKINNDSNETKNNNFNNNENFNYNSINNNNKVFISKNSKKIINNIKISTEKSVFTPKKTTDEKLNFLEDENEKKLIERDRTSSFVINSKKKEEQYEYNNHNNDSKNTFIENKIFKNEDKKENTINDDNKNNINEINKDNKDNNNIKDNNKEKDENLISLINNSNIFSELQMNNSTNSNFIKTKEEETLKIIKREISKKKSTNTNISKNNEINTLQNKETISVNFSLSNYNENFINKDNNLNKVNIKEIEDLKKEFETENQNTNINLNQTQSQNQTKSNLNINISHLNKKIEEENSNTINANNTNNISNITNNTNNVKYIDIIPKKLSNNYSNNNQIYNHLHRQISYHNNNNNNNNKRNKDIEPIIITYDEDNFNKKTDRTAHMISGKKNINISYNKENQNPNNSIIYHNKNFLAKERNKAPYTKITKNCRQKMYYGESKSINKTDNKKLYSKQKLYRHTSPDNKYNYHYFNNKILITDNENSYRNNISYMSGLNTNRTNISNYNKIFNNIVAKKRRYNKNNYNNNEYFLYNPYDSVEENIYINNNKNIYRNKNLSNKLVFYDGNTLNNTTFSSLYNNYNDNKNYLKPLLNINSLKTNSFSNINNNSSYKNSNNNIILISENNADITRNNNSYQMGQISISPQRTISNNILIRLRDWLISCDLLCYYNILIKNNMYDIDRYIEEIRNNRINISFRDVEELGIRKPGHIFRLLLKLEVDAGKINNNIYNYIIEKFNINTASNNEFLTNSISDMKCCGINCYSTNNNYNNSRFNNYNNFFNDNYYNSNYDENKTGETENDYSEEINYMDILSFLRKKNLWKFKENFIHNGFDQIEYILIQLFSQYTFDKNILNDYMHIYLDEDKNYVLKILYKEKKKLSTLLGIQYNNEELKQILLSQSSNLDYYSNYMNSVVRTRTNSIYNNNNNCCSIF